MSLEERIISEINRARDTRRGDFIEVHCAHLPRFRATVVEVVSTSQENNPKIVLVRESSGVRVLGGGTRVAPCPPFHKEVIF